MANVAVGFISDEKIDSTFVSCLLSLMAQRGDDIRGRVVHTQGVAGRLDIGRHIVAQTFLDKTDADYLLFIDADMVFTPEDYSAVVSGAEKADEPCVVSGLYARQDGSLCVYDLGDEGYELADPTRMLSVSWYEAGAVGLGFCLIPRVVLESVRENTPGFLPWFENGADGPGHLADDTSFCYRVGEAGFKIFVDLRVKVGHIKTVTMYPKLESQLLTPEKGLIVP